MTWSISGWSLNCRHVLTSRGPWPLDTSTPHITGCSLKDTEPWAIRQRIVLKFCNSLLLQSGAARTKESWIKVHRLTSGRNGWWVQVWSAVWIRDLHHKGTFCSAANTICEGGSRRVWLQKYILAAQHKSGTTQKRDVFTVWEGRVGRTAAPERCCMSKRVPAHGAVFGVWSLAPADQPLCSGSNTAG